MYLSFEQIEADDTVKDVSDLTVPANATGAELQADTQDVRYTMDDNTDPSESSGMILGTTHDPKEFLIMDVRRIRFIRGAGSNGKLNIHYFAGRDV